MRRVATTLAFGLCMAAAYHASAHATLDQPALAPPPSPSPAPRADRWEWDGALLGGLRPARGNELDDGWPSDGRSRTRSSGAEQRLVPRAPARNHQRAQVVRDSAPSPRGVPMMSLVRSTAVAVALSGAAAVPSMQAQSLHATLVRRVPHAGIGREIAFSPDSRTLATSSADGTITLRRVADGATLRTITHPGGATSVAFSRDGTMLVSGGYDATVRLWRVSDGAPLRALAGHRHTVWTVATSPDGERIASAGEDSTVRIWRLADGAPLRTLRGHARNVWSVAFSPDGKHVASGSFDKTVKLWTVETGALERTLTDATEAVVHVAFSPDGSLVGGSGDDSSIKLWNATDGSLVRTLTGGSSHIYSFAFSADGRWLASGGRGQSAIATFWKQLAGYRWSPNGKTVRLWRVRDGALLSVLADHVDDVWSVAVSPDGAWLASASEEGTVNLYQLRPR